MSVRWTEQQLHQQQRSSAKETAIDVPKKTVKAKGKKNENGLNKLEQAYADELEMQRQRGEIELWKAHPFGLRLANKTFYHPDFLVMLTDGSLEIHETKGFMRDDANVKLKVAAAQFPFVFRLVKKKGKTWKITTI